MSEEAVHDGSCFCGAVKFILTGVPEVMAYCHCDSCRHWSAGPVSAFTLWSPGSLAITEGQDKIAGYTGNPGAGDEPLRSERQWCTECDGHIYTNHPVMRLVDVPVAVIRHFDFAPAFHVHYQETVHRMADGLPKFKDLPTEAGGSGTRLPEML